MESLSEAQVWRWLEEVEDPELPVVSVVELGIVRKVAIEGECVQVAITPTFSGCPALHAMQEGIRQRLMQAGVKEVEIEVVHAPAWSSDWITPEARRKLKAFGLAPPPVHGGSLKLITLEIAACPYCDSENTTIKNSFGPTLCRAIYYCNDCRQPFEQFKAL